MNFDPADYSKIELRVLSWALDKFDPTGMTVEDFYRSTTLTREQAQSNTMNRAQRRYDRWLRSRKWWRGPPPSHIQEKGKRL